MAVDKGCKGLNYDYYHSISEVRRCRVIVYTFVYLFYYYAAHCPEYILLNTRAITPPSNTQYRHCLFIPLMYRS
jgi:hypothetical protein